MTSNNGTQSQDRAAIRKELEGYVQAVSRRGVKIDGEWLNFSQFAEVPRPERGQTVRIGLDKDGFIRRLEPTSTPEAPGRSVPAGEDRRQTLIIRQTCVKAAVAFLAPRQDAKCEHVTQLAEKLEMWITR